MNSAHRRFLIFALLIPVKHSVSELTAIPSANFIPRDCRRRGLRNFVAFIAVTCLAGICASCAEVDPERGKPGSERSPHPGDSAGRERPLPFDSDTSSSAFTEVFHDSAQNLNTAFTERETTTAETLSKDSLADTAFEIDDIPLPDFPHWWDAEEYVTTSGEEEFAQSRLIATALIPVISPEPRDDYDSVMIALEERLSIRPDRAPASVVLERWRSPVNYKGYQFNRRKLVLFGVEPHIPVGVYHFTGEYYFSLARKLYELDVQPEFSPLRTVKDTALSRYLLDFED